MKSSYRILLAFCLLMFLAACDSRLASSVDQNNNSQRQTGQELELVLTSIEPQSGQHYEGWIVGSAGVETSGRFNVRASGEIVSVDLNGNELSVIGSNDVAKFDYTYTGEASAFVLTIEPNGDADAGPSSVHYVAGDFENNVATAVTSHSAAMGAQFLSSLGSYFLATPTNGPSTHNQGVWFLDAGAPSLVLPDLNTGWAYEGWIVNTQTGEVFSTGIFNSVSGADSDGPGSAAGPNPAPAFPGQDYINPAMILNDGNHAVVISVEPSPDFDPAPFTLKILAHDIANGAPVTTNIDMNNISNESNISIRAEIK